MSIYILFVYVCVSVYVSNYTHRHTPHITDLVYFDAPQNILNKIVDWEYQLDQIFLNKLFKQVNACDTGNWQVFVIMHKFTDSKLVHDSLKTNGYQQMQPIFWYKTPEHKGSGPVSSYTSAVECGTIGFKPHAAACGFFMSTDPRKRHNHFTHKSVTSYFKDSDGNVVNPTENPPELLQWLCNNHLEPSSNVLIIGAGSGSDIIGAARACCNVVAVENNQRQFENCQIRLIDYVDTEYKAMCEAANRENVESNATSQQQFATLQNPDHVFNSQPSTGEVICLACANVIEPEGLDPTRVCFNCSVQGPLHEGCCSLTPDGYLCTTCEESEEVAATQQEYRFLCNIVVYCTEFLSFFVFLTPHYWYGFLFKFILQLYLYTYK